MYSLIAVVLLNPFMMPQRPVQRPAVVVQRPVAVMQWPAPAPVVMFQRPVAPVVPVVTVRPRRICTPRGCYFVYPF
jgi:hypothetical protein